MSIAPYLREIGRGKEGARSLGAEQAEDLMSRLLGGRVSDLELGAFVLAMRIKGESVDELTGFLRAARPWCLAPALPEGAARAVWLPSYNGARKLPNLTALLALALAREGVPVLVHGPLADPGRVTTAEVFAALGVAPCGGSAAIEAAWRRGEPAFVPTAVLCPPLERLLQVRRVVGLRNSGHTVVKVLQPHGREVLRVVNHTHPEYAGLLGGFLTATGADAMLLRGTEGEPVADARRTPRMEVLLGGRREPACCVPAHDGVLGALPALPRNTDAAATAAYLGEVLAQRQPLPAPIALQVGALRRALGLLAALPRESEFDVTPA